MAMHFDADDPSLDLAQLLDAFERGEEVVLARAGRPLATLTAYVPPRRKQKILPPGSLGDPGWDIPDDVWDPMELVYTRDICRDPTPCERPIHVPPDELSDDRLAEHQYHDRPNQ